LFQEFVFSEQSQISLGSVIAAAAGYPTRLPDYTRYNTINTDQRSTMFENEDPQITVAAAIILQDSKVLICQRSINHRYGLKWEFPGGKTYPGESLIECLKRELEEELNIIPLSYQPMRTLQAEYSDGGNFLISFFLVEQFEGILENNVFDDIAWVTFDELGNYDLLEGSKPILAHLQGMMSSA
jgi:8-oxo-dGTP diphosphatase